MAKPRIPTLKPAVTSAIADYSHQLMTVKDLPPDDSTRLAFEQQALFDLTKVMRQNNLSLIFSDHRKLNFPSTNQHITLTNSSKAASTYQTANLAMDAAGDAKALAILGVQGDTITRYPLAPYAINIRNSSSLLVINDAMGQSRGIYHVAGDQFHPRLEYRPVTTTQALGLLEEAIEAAKKRDMFNAGNPAVTTSQEQKYQGLMHDFINHSTRIDTIKTPPPGARAVQKEYWDGDKDHMSQAKQKITPDQFWGKVTPDYFDYVRGETELLFEQPIMLKDGSRDSYINLYVVKQDGVPRIFMATRGHDVYFKEITHDMAKRLIESDHLADAAKGISEKFSSQLTEHGYFQQNASALSATASTKNIPTLVNKQSGYVYAIPEWVNEHSLTDIKQGFSKVMDGIEHAMNKTPAISQALSKASLAPAIFRIAEQTYETGKESLQSGLNTATQGIAELDIAIETGAMASAYTLPLLANPYGEVAYLGYTTLAAIGGSQAMQTLKDGAIWGWEKLAVEPLRAQAEARAAEKAQQAAALREHEAVLSKIPDDSPSKSQAELVAQQVATNAARNGWSALEALTAIDIASKHTAQPTEPAQAQQHPSPQIPEPNGP